MKQSIIKLGIGVAAVSSLLGSSALCAMEAEEETAATPTPLIFPYFGRDFSLTGLGTGYRVFGPAAEALPEAEDPPQAKTDPDNPYNLPDLGESRESRLNVGYIVRQVSHHSLRLFVRHGKIERDDEVNYFGMPVTSGYRLEGPARHNINASMPFFLAARSRTSGAYAYDHEERTRCRLADTIDTKGTIAYVFNNGNSRFRLDLRHNRAFLTFHHYTDGMPSRDAHKYACQYPSPLRGQLGTVYNEIVHNNSRIFTALKGDVDEKLGRAGIWQNEYTEKERIQQRLLETKKQPWLSPQPLQK
jgi:hypothetical protein